MSVIKSVRNFWAFNQPLKDLYYVDSTANVLTAACDPRGSRRLRLELEPRCLIRSSYELISHRFRQDLLG